MLTQAKRESDRETRNQTEHSASVQSEKCQSLSPQRRIPDVLGLYFATLGRQISGSMVYKNHAIKNRTHEESSQNCSTAQAAYPEWVQGKKGVFERYC